jgi:hypothetical protein
MPPRIQRPPRSTAQTAQTADPEPQRLTRQKRPVGYGEMVELNTAGNQQGQESGRYPSTRSSKRPASQLVPHTELDILLKKAKRPRVERSQQVQESGQISPSRESMAPRTLPPASLRSSAAATSTVEASAAGLLLPLGTPSPPLASGSGRSSTPVLPIMDMDAAIRKIAGGPKPPNEIHDRIKSVLETIDPTDRAAFVSFVDRLDRAGDFHPKLFLKSLPLIATIPPGERAELVNTVGEICHGSLRGESQSEAEEHLSIIGLLLQLPPDERLDAGRIARETSRTNQFLAASLEHLIKVPDAANRRRYGECLKTLGTPSKTFHSEVATALLSLDVSSAERATHRLTRDFPAIILPHRKAGEVLAILGRIAEADYAPFPALVEKLNECTQFSTEMSQRKIIEERCNNLVHLSRCEGSAAAVVDTLSQQPALLRPTQVTEGLSNFLHLKKSLSEHGRSDFESRQRLERIENCARNLGISIGRSQTLTQWLGALPDEDLAGLDANMKNVAPGPERMPPHLEAAMLQSALRITSPLQATDVQERSETWHRLVDTLVADNAMRKPWDTLPLGLLHPFRDRVAEGLAKHHSAESLHRKSFNLDSPEHRLTNYYQLLQEGHAWKFFSLKENEMFDFKRAEGIQGNKDVRTAFLEAAQTIDQYEAVCLAYESSKFQELAFEPCKQRANELNLPMILIPNATAGATAVTALNFQKIQEGGTKVFMLKQGSTQASSSSFDTGNLTLEFLNRFFENPALVVVADLSQYDQYPNAFKSFRNIAAAINHVWGKDNSEAWRAAGLDAFPFQPDSSLDVMMEQLRNMASRHPVPDKGLELHYTTLNGRELPTHFYKDEKIRPSTPDQIHGPGFYLVQTSFSEEDLQKDAENGDRIADEILRFAAQNDLHHEQGHFDDDDLAQNPWVYPSKYDALKINPPVHPPARDNLKAMKTGEFGGPASARKS